MNAKSLADKIMMYWMAFCVLATLGTIVLVCFGYPAAILLQSSSLLVGFILVLPVTTIWPKYPWFINLVSRLNKRYLPVELFDYHCERVYSIAMMAEDGRLHAATYWMNNIGDSILLPDGRVDPESPSSYHYFWLPMDKSQRTAMILTNDFPDFDMISQLPERERHAILYTLRNKP